MNVSDGLKRRCLKIFVENHKKNRMVSLNALKRNRGGVQFAIDFNGNFCHLEGFEISEKSFARERNFRSDKIGDINERLGEFNCQFKSWEIELSFCLVL